MRRLGVFTRAGLILTAWWMLLGGGYLGAKAGMRQYDVATAMLGVCVEGIYNSPGVRDPDAIKRCDETFRRDNAFARSVFWSQFGGAVAIAAMWAILGWLLGIAAYWSVRWILAGRRRPEE